MSDSFITREEYNKDYKRIDVALQNQAADIQAVSSKIAGVDVLMDILKKLPDSNTQLQLQQVEVGKNFETLFEKIDGLGDKITYNKLDTDKRIEESETRLKKEIETVKTELQGEIEATRSLAVANKKTITTERMRFMIDGAKFVKDNWWAIMLVAATVSIVIANKFSEGFF